MAMKARIMRDEETAERITKAPTPAEAKKLGREVKNFNQQVGYVTSPKPEGSHLTDAECFHL